nr:immunoglobulin heavy chain junction region [Macaca mulatta]MPN69899.1 immunoglobulin heavy chain junction region [Macaca mulatta]MPN70150.1 immunoglobulin heavy chain junction region [Macaca mulatta]MPN71133.1 immunoglobulin heavy chain junction region [Macaca mulatta]MPN72798.1 immunoglobulin heavy chain junction region [Macaca mulatta]
CARDECSGGVCYRFVYGLDSW